MLNRVVRFGLVIVIAAAITGTALGQWYPPEQITSNSFDELVYPGSLAIDGNDLLHAAWMQSDPVSGDRRIVYIEGRQGDWTAPVEIPAPLAVCNHPDLAVHLNGDAHLVWMQESGDQGEVFYTTNSSGQWVYERLTNNATADVDPVVAVDGDNVPHAAWAGYDPASGQGKIFYATNSSGNWVVDVLSGSSIGGFWTGADPRISVSQAGVVQIAYRGGDYGSYGVHLATNMTGAWTYQALPSGNADDFTGSVRTDFYNTCYLAISGNDGWGMPGHVYYSESADQGAGWSTPELLSGNNSGVGAVLSVDWHGQSHVAWEETSGNFYTGKIYYSTNETGSWSSNPIATKDENAGPSIVVDGSGGVHVFYVNGYYSGGFVKEVYYLTDSNPILTLSMKPQGATVIPRGGTLSLDMTVENWTSSAVPADFLMTAIVAASGAEIRVPSPFLNIPNPAHGTVNTVINLTAVLSVPTNAPLGLFTLVGSLGQAATATFFDKAAVSIRIVP